MKRIVFCIVCFAAVVSCSDTLELPKIGRVTEFRALAVQAEPAEPSPGRGMTLSVLWADPKGAGRNVWFAWFICSRWTSPSDDLSSCNPLVPPQVGSAENSGHIFDVSSIPADILDDLPEEEDSLDVTVAVLMCAGGTLPNAKEIVSRLDVRVPSTLCDGGEGMTVFKSIKISQSANPNTNPVIENLKYNGEVFESAETERVESIPCNDLNACMAEISVTLTAESQQQCDNPGSDEIELKHEDLYVSWYVNGGELDRLQSGAEDPVGPYTMYWHLDRETPVTLWAVAHDNRGGVSWKTITVQPR